MELIDTHTHLDNSQLDADRAAVFARMRQAGVGMALIPNVDDESWPRMLALGSMMLLLVLALSIVLGVSLSALYGDERLSAGNVVKPIWLFTTT